MARAADRNSRNARDDPLWLLGGANVTGTDNVGAPEAFVVGGNNENGSDSDDSSNSDSDNSDNIVHSLDLNDLDEL